MKLKTQLSSHTHHISVPSKAGGNCMASTDDKLFLNKPFLYIPLISKYPQPSITSNHSVLDLWDDVFKVICFSSRMCLWECSVHDEESPPLCWPTWGKPPHAPAPHLFMWHGHRSSWKLGASWLSSAEVRPVIQTGSLLQEWMADRVLRQMEPRPALTYPKVPPLMKSVESTSVLFSHNLLLIIYLFFYFRISCLSSENEEYVTRNWEIPRVLFLSFVTIDRFRACFLSCSLHCSWSLDIFISDAKINKIAMDPFFFVKEKYFDFFYSEAAQLLRKLKWAQHEIVFIPSKHALSSLSRTQG